MTALPPPKPEAIYSKIGLEIGVIYGLASMIPLGIFAAVFPVAGLILGLIAEKVFD